jgi:hypothetical protein
MTVVTHDNLTPYQPQPTGRRLISRIGLVGSGDVVRSRYSPALRSRSNRLAEIVICSIEPSAPELGFAYRYHRVRPGNELPLQVLAEEGFITHNALWIIATPSDTHVPYTLQLADFCRVAVEKPIAATIRQARLLAPLRRAAYEVIPIDHKIYNRSVLAFIERISLQPDIMTRVARIEGTFYERDGIRNGRHQEDGIADVQWHLAAATRALFRAAQLPSPMYLDEVLVARHRPDPSRGVQTPNVWSASRIRGHLSDGRQVIPFDFCQAKAAPGSEKRIRLFDASGALIADIDLNESGWHAHARVLDALMQPAVEMHHTLADALDVMEFVEHARVRAHEEPAHAFGDLPAFCE